MEINREEIPPLTLKRVWQYCRTLKKVGLYQSSLKRVGLLQEFSERRRAFLIKTLKRVRHSYIIKIEEESIKIFMNTKKLKSRSQFGGRFTRQEKLLIDLFGPSSSKSTSRNPLPIDSSSTTRSPLSTISSTPLRNPITSLNNNNLKNSFTKLLIINFKNTFADHLISSPKNSFAILLYTYNSKNFLANCLTNYNKDFIAKNAITKTCTSSITCYSSTFKEYVEVDTIGFISSKANKTSITSSSSLGSSG